MRIDFPQLGEGYFVEIKDPKKLKWKEKKEITKQYKEGDIPAQLDLSEYIAVVLIKSGYMLDEDKKPITFPLTADTVGDVPADVVEEVVKAFGTSYTDKVAEKN
jgi:hypothetical protein